MISEEQHKELLDEVQKLRKRIEDIEFANDAALFTSYMANLDRPTIYRCIESAVARYFNIPFTDFYNSLLIGKRGGKNTTARLLPDDPSNIEDKYTREIIARQCLFGILHIEFHVPIPRLMEFYNTNPTNYIREWRERFVRIFYSGGETPARYDLIYERYWRGCFKEAVFVSQEMGLYDELIERLSEGNVDKLSKWRVK